jgi:hypothetical protein
MTEALPYDLWDSRITYAEAARLAGVEVTVVRMWVSRGYTDHDGQHVKLERYVTVEGPRLQPIAVLRAEAATRARARRVVGR